VKRCWPLLLAFTTAICAFLLPQSSAVAESSSSRELTGNQLLQIGEIHERQRHFHEALNYYQLALATFRERRQTRGIAAALVKIAQLHEGHGDFAEASRGLKEAISLYSRPADSLARARALVAMGRVSARLGHIDEAGASFRQALSRFATAKEQRDWTEAAIQLGLLLVGNESPEEGLALLQRARDDSRDRHDLDQELNALTAEGTALWLLERRSESRRCYDEALALAAKERNMPVEARLRLRLGYLLADEGHGAEALEVGKRALLLAQTLRDAEAEAATLTLLADLYRRLGRAAEMADAGDRALEIYRTRTLTVHGGR
jgi:tetratricopeptide (TPR) repeat protein